VSPEHLNVYDVVRAQVVVIPERELGRVKEVWS
jgi:large subunit ribosomal protein L4